MQQAESRGNRPGSLCKKTHDLSSLAQALPTLDRPWGLSSLHCGLPGHRQVCDTIPQPLQVLPPPPWFSPLTFASNDALPAGQSESVRDVQFSIRDYFTFASTFENGNVQLWDIRRPDRCERMFTAHNGPVFCCDWHPEDRCGLGYRDHRAEGL